MASIVPGFGCDIFISYRHNDNRTDWVTDFVSALQIELAATIKEPISIYFDRNPHDGLLETHSVDKSLEGKLKCLIFIPVISQTYCDPRSFAWQHEFCAFNKLAREDQFGREVKLGNGNVSSRILPIRIHDLDTDDRAIIEGEIAGVLRPIDFIYNEPGVNRPLEANDNKNENQNRTDYRNQVNKVANAVKEIVVAVTKPTHQTLRGENVERFAKGRFSVTRPAIISLVALCAVITAYLIYQWVPATAVHDGNEPAMPLDKSIVVLPFIDLSPQKDQNWFTDGLTEEILNSLAQANDLKVISRTSSFAFKDKNLPVQSIADSLGVNYVVEGSVRKSESGIRVTAQLIRAADGFHIWSNSYDRTLKDIFQVQHEIATRISESLDVSLDPDSFRQMHMAGTSNPEAYLAFLKGQELFREGHKNRYRILEYLKEANVSFDQALLLDPGFASPSIFHADYYLHYIDHTPDSRNDTLSEKSAYRHLHADFESSVRRASSEAEKNFYRLHAIMYSNDWSLMRSITEQLLKSPDATRVFSNQSFSLVRLVYSMGFQKEITAMNRAILENDPLNIEIQRDIIWATMRDGDYEKALEEIRQLNNPTDPELLFYEFFMLYRLGRNDAARALLHNKDRVTMRFYDTALAMMLARDGNLQKAREVIANDPKKDYLLFAIDEVLGREAANREARLLDMQATGFALYYSYMFSPRQTPFDFSAAPNFAKRLGQIGVSIDQP
jgi:adenylate cyclase